MLSRKPINYETQTFCSGSYSRKTLQRRLTRKNASSDEKVTVKHPVYFKYIRQNSNKCFTKQCYTVQDMYDMIYDI